MRLVAYNLGQGGSRDSSVWKRVLPELSPDVLFVQESREPAQSWLVALPRTGNDSWHWVSVPGGRWGSGLWVRDGSLTPLAVPDDFTGRVAAAVINGLAWPDIGVAPVVALSIHAPTRKGSSYIKEVGLILDFAGALAEGRPLILAGDFNVAVGLREPGLPLYNTRGERAILQRLREELHLIPCWQTAHPGEPLARTLRWMRRSDSLPYHCDGIFVPAAWATALQSCEVLEGEVWRALSDHNPVVAALTLDTP
jgi:endonuclease/exonuclease/phosphatase family metal-dependent hydrolase